MGQNSPVQTWSQNAQVKLLLLKKIERGTAAGGDLVCRQYAKTGVFHRLTQAIGRPAPIVMRARVIPECAVRRHQQLAAGLQHAKAFGKINRGIEDVLKNLGRENEIVVPHLRRQAAVRCEWKIEICSASQVGPMIDRPGEQRTVRRPAATVIKHARGVQESHLPDGIEQIDETEIIGIPWARLQSKSDIFI